MTLDNTNIALQWGRDQMVAEMHSNEDTEKGLAELQWGRDQMVAEIAFPRARVPDEHQCFNGAATRWSRKWDSLLTDRRDPGMLQWGRDQMVAEITPGSRAWQPALTLQWGRDQMVAEIGRPATQ